MITASVIALVMTSGLSAGFFFAYWCSVMIGLRNVSDKTFVETMQAINAVLPNGRFVVPFFAPVVLAPICTWLTFAEGYRTSGWWCLAATVLSVITFVITPARNVPMNKALAAAGPPETPELATLTREAFEKPWTFWNDIRAYTSILAFAASVGALAMLP